MLPEVRPEWIDREPGPIRGVYLPGAMVNAGMAQRLNPERRPLNRILAKAQKLAEQVRETAERVHQQAREARRLIEVARQQAERGRILSKAGRDEARAVADWLKSSGDIAGNGSAAPRTRRPDAGHPAYRKNNPC
jgi:hypothetical protein